MQIEDTFHYLTPEQRAYLKGIRHGWNMAAEEMRRDYEKMFKQFKDEVNAEMRAIRTAHASPARD